MSLKLQILVGGLLSKIDSALNKCRYSYSRTKFKKIGWNSYLSRDCIFTYDTITIGEHTYVGPRCVFQSAHGEIVIGNHVMFGPGVHIHGGNHLIDKVGIYMDEVVKEKGCDGIVSIEDDVWVGANAILLKGVTIGEGAVVAAGSIVSKDVPPYSVVAGIPATVKKMRFTAEEIELHRQNLKKRSI